MNAKLFFGFLLVACFYAVSITHASVVPCLRPNSSCSNAANATRCCVGYCDKILDRSKYNALSIGTYCCKHGNGKWPLCKYNWECCSRNCNHGKCQDCKKFHKPCLNKKECCTGDCTRIYDQYQFNGLSRAKYCCKPSVGNDTRCIYDWECCATPKTKASQEDWTLTTSCQNGHCKPCTPLYHTCSNETNSRKCCAGVCSNIYKSDTYNKLSVGRPQCCLKGSASCNDNWQCCSQKCIKKGTSVVGQCRDCKYLNQSCSILSQCCAGICTKPWPYKHWTPKQCCLPNLQKCKNNVECCSKRCGQFNKLGFGKCLPHLPFPIKI